jgi:tetratricopeptide (TPR) repeat protein
LTGRRNGNRLRHHLREGYSRLHAGDAASARRIAHDLLLEDSAFIGAHLLLAQAATAEGEWSTAFSAIERVLATHPMHADAYFIRGMMHEQRGSADPAIADYARVLEIDPSHAPALDRKGALHDGRGEFRDSLACAECLVRLDHANADAHHKMGLTLRALGRLSEAEQAMRVAVKLDPRFHDASSHLALVLLDQGRFDEADAVLANVLNEEADHPEARWTRGVLNLLRGHFEVAWDDYEWRETRRDSIPRVSAVPEWDAAPIHDGCLLIYAEQGLGDQIMFASCIADALRLSPACIVECDRRLEALFRRSFPSVRVVGASGKYPPEWLPTLDSAIKAQISIASLPSRFRRSAGNFPSQDRYLIPDQAAVSSWRTRLSRLGPGAKIGLSWTGGSPKTRRSLRSIPLEQLLPLFTSGRPCHFVSLQYVDSAAEIKALHERHQVKVHQLDEIGDSYDRAAELIGALDLVISVCTSAIHLAGAIGTPVWIMVPASPEWRYMAAGTGMPWYSSATIWRQTKLGEWNDVIQSVASELASFCGTLSESKPFGTGS